MGLNQIFPVVLDWVGLVISQLVGWVGSGFWTRGQLCFAAHFLDGFDRVQGNRATVCLQSVRVDARRVTVALCV